MMTVGLLVCPFRPLELHTRFRFPLISMAFVVLCINLTISSLNRLTDSFFNIMVLHVSI